MALYEVRDVLYSVAQAPDKLRSRTLLHWRSQAAEGAPAAYLWLKDLRGRLVEADSSDEKVWAVASLDGTDPDAPAPEPGVRLVVCLFNDDTRPREVDLTLAAPAGTTFVAAPAGTTFTPGAGGALPGGTVEALRQDPATFAWGVRRETASARGTSHAMKVAMPGKSAWKIVLPLEGTPPGSAEVRRTQFFSPDILQAVTAEKPFATRVAIDPAPLKAAGRAWLRLVIEDAAPGEATVSVGGRTIPLPKAYTPENANLTVMVPIDLAALAAETAVEFRVNPGNFAGYRVDVTSIVLE
jgi:hypothetical protein